MKTVSREVSATGMVTTMGFQDDKLVTKYEQDVAPSLDYAGALRNSDEYSKEGIKQGLWHCVHIPEAVIMQMAVEDGFKEWEHTASELRQFLSRNKAKYGYLFTTKGAF